MAHRQAAVASLALAAAMPVAGEPLWVTNQSPVAALLGLPAQQDAAGLAAGGWELAVHGSLASHFIEERSGSESLLLDGETGRLTLAAMVAPVEGWTFGVALPWLHHSGGQLDSLIDDWHQLWGMPDGGREDAPRDRLRYAWQGDGSFLLADDSSGIGDTSLWGAWRFHQGEASAAALVAGYKFATGDEADFHGSGGDDAWLALRYSGNHGAEGALRWHGQFGYLRAGASDLMRPAQERDLWFAGASVDWQLAERWSLLAQLDAHAAPMDSAITGIGDDALMLSLGGRWRFAPDWALELSLVEDVRVETAADVAFQASLRYRPDSRASAR